MDKKQRDGLQKSLESKKSELLARLERITANLRSGLETDSKERAKQLEDSEVVDALGNEARVELEKVSLALRRLADGTYGTCLDCGKAISDGRIAAYAYANHCIDCATRGEELVARD